MATRRRTSQSRAAIDKIALKFALATERDAPDLAALQNAVADELTRTHGRGPWSGQCTERGILLGIRTSRVIVARTGRGRSARIVGVLRLATRKPWAIDVTYFTSVKRALYLLDMAVTPALQRRGIGRRMLTEAVRFARDYPTSPSPQVIRLDAYDTGDGGAGAGRFYARCGYREVARVTFRRTPLIYFEMVLEQTERA